MAEGSTIEWTDATWNPTRGCTRVSQGCVNCYAEVMAARFSKPGLWGHGFAEMKGGDHRWTGKVELVRSQLSWPERYRGPKVPVRGAGTKPLVFTNSTSDLFHEYLSDDDIWIAFAAMAAYRHIDYQVLTKRPERASKLLNDPYAIDAIYAQWSGVTGRPAEIEAWPLPNVWLGVSAEDQATADERIEHLLMTPAAVRFVSAEPLLGPIDFTADTEIGPLSFLRRHNIQNDELTNRIDWIIVGGESGHHARPFDIEWARSIVAQCRAANVACFVKQLGSNPTLGGVELGILGAGLRDKKGGDWSEWPEDIRVREFPA